MKHPAKKFGVVVWDDAVGSGSEVPEEEMVHAPMRFHLYGWIVRSDDKGVTIASEWRPADNFWRDRSFIPRAMVVEERVLALNNPRKRSSESKPSTPSVLSSSSSSG